MFKLDSVAIVGVGMIGASIARALRKNRVAQDVIGCDSNPCSLQYALDHHFIDFQFQDVAAAFQKAEVLVVAVPVAEIPTVFASIAAASGSNAIVTDVASVKMHIARAAADTLPASIPFVPGHPIAGTENSGVQAAVEDLFVKRQVVLTPKRKDASECGVIRAMWEKIGGCVSYMTPAEHDHIFSQVSHLPHLIAYALSSSLCDQKQDYSLFNYGGGGLRDFTRIASSDPDMWQDIFAMNASNLLHSCDLFSSKIEELRTMIENNDREGLCRKLTQIRNFLRNSE